MSWEELEAAGRVRTDRLSSKTTWLSFNCDHNLSPPFSSCSYHNPSLHLVRVVLCQTFVKSENVDMFRLVNDLHELS